MRFLGSAACYPHIDGGFAQYVPVPAINCLPLPEGMDYGYAALLEPLTVAVHAVRRPGAIGGGALAGKSVLITGAGTIGQLALRVARSYGAGMLAVSDVDDFARTSSLEAGADHAFDPGDPEMEDIARELSKGGFEVIIEISGVPAALGQALCLARRGGTIVQVGSLPHEVTLPANLIMAKELAVLGSFRSVNVMYEALDLAASGRIDLDPIITSVFDFRELPLAMETAVKKDKVIKVQIKQEG